MKIALVSLGCVKNLVDSEMVLGLLKKSKGKIINDVEKADVIIVNTCGFIESAKQESINTILEMTDYNKKLIVMGCLVERYYDDLVKEIPEVDLFIRIKDYPKIDEILDNFLGLDVKNKLNMHDRLLSTPKHLAYLRISDGCNNKCHYCAIPLIRGEYVSRPFEDIILEAKELAKKGVKELVLISQDTTRYGTDLANGESIVSLLKELDKIEGFEFIRFLYLYPNDVTDELIECVKNSKNITPYFDVPIQHASDKMLANMNRRGTNEDMKFLFKKIRESIPHAVLRTTLIIGYPTEDDNDHEILKDFIKEVRFDKLGAFTYSREEDTVSYDMPQVDSEIAQKRYEEILNIQEELSLEKGQERIGQIHKVIIEDFEGYYYLGRSYAFAPDDIDGYIFVESDEELSVGDIVHCEIFDADSYNLFGRKIS